MRASKESVTMSVIADSANASAEAATRKRWHDCTQAGQFPFHEKAIQVEADVAAFLKIIASVWLHDSTPTHGRRQPAAAPTQVCVCMGPLSLISGRGSERPGDVKSARSGRGAANP